MFGSIGGFEMVVLAIIGLLVFGPRRLPEIGRTLGKAMVEFRRAAMELRTSIEREVNLEEVRETTRSIRKAMGGDLVGETLKEAIPDLGTDLGKDLGPDLRKEAAEIAREAEVPAAGEGRGTGDAARRD